MKMHQQGQSFVRGLDFGVGEFRLWEADGDFPHAVGIEMRGMG